MQHVIPPTMTAIAIRTPGGPDVLVPETRPVPEPQAEDILVKVIAAGINRPDVMQRLGKYNPPPGTTDIPGLEVAGIVVAHGENVRRFHRGDRVCGLLAGGGYAQYAVGHESTFMPIPDEITDIEAAAIPETYMTVWSNVFDRGRLKAEETLLVHGGTSGIGTTAILLGKAFRAKVLVTVRNAEKVAACITMGADEAFNYLETDFVDDVKRVTNGHGADVILDMVGGDYISRNFDAAAIEGRIVQIAFQKGSKVEVDFMRLMLKRLTMVGATLRARPIHEKAQLARALETQVWPLLRKGQCKPIIYRTFPLEQAAEAHRLMESSEHIGKIVLTLA